MAHTHAVHSNGTVDTRVLEIRTYRLKPGRVAEFDATMRERSVPLLRRFGIDVVGYGPSQELEDGVRDYLLMRAYSDPVARERQEHRFYSSPDWRDGPAHDVLDAIDSYHTVVLTAPDAAIEHLRHGGDLPESADPIE